MVSNAKSDPVLTAPRSRIPSKHSVDPEPVEGHPVSHSTALLIRSLPRATEFQAVFIRRFVGFPAVVESNLRKTDLLEHEDELIPSHKEKIGSVTR